MTDNTTSRRIEIFNRDYYITSDARLFNQHGREIKARTEQNGYKRFTISKNGLRKHIFAHRLVADAFLDNSRGLAQVNHIDGNPSNNRVDNLEWVSPGENQLHSRYVLNNNTGFKDTPVECIETGRKYRSTRDAWRETGVSYSHISEVARGKRKSAGGYHWKQIGGDLN